MGNSEAIDKVDVAGQAQAVLRVAMPERRIGALEKIVVIERRLRALYLARAVDSADATVRAAPVAVEVDKKDDKKTTKKTTQQTVK